VTEQYRPDARFVRKPAYAGLFSSDVSYSEHYTPLLATDRKFTNFTVPHGLDRSVATALPGLWYCLHLPNDLLELIDTPARILKQCQVQHLDHEIVLAPIQIFNPDTLGRWLERTYPILSYPILSYPILSYPILSYPILSYPILSYPILSYPSSLPR